MKYLPETTIEAALSQTACRPSFFARVLGWVRGVFTNQKIEDETTN